MRPPGTAPVARSNSEWLPWSPSWATSARSLFLLGDRGLQVQAARGRQGGPPGSTATRISGHRTSSVFRRYRIVETKDLLSALTQTESTLKADPHKPAMFPHNGIDQPQQVAREPIRRIVILRKECGTRRVTSTGK